MPPPARSQPVRGRLLLDGLLLTVVWAALYLPWLGSREFKNEEGRRVLPAIAMLQDHDWMHPKVGGLPYFAKPPGINWLIAGSFVITGRIDEWSARLPSVTAILALALALRWGAATWLGPPAALAAALMSLTAAGLWEKGRLAEIDAVYVACSGITTAAWIHLRTGTTARGRAAAWVLLTLALGFGLLTKGPFLLLLHLGIAAAWSDPRERRRQLADPKHLAALALAILPLAFWMVLQPGTPTSRGTAWDSWNLEIQERLLPSDFQIREWAGNLLRHWANALPWLLLALPAHRTNPTAGDFPPADRDRSRRLTIVLLSMAIPLSLFPGSHARYTLPLLPAAFLLLAFRLAGLRFEFPQTAWHRVETAMPVACLGILGLTAFAIPVAPAFLALTAGAAATLLLVGCLLIPAIPGLPRQIALGTIWGALLTLAALNLVMPRIVSRGRERAEAARIAETLSTEGHLPLYAVRPRDARVLIRFGTSLLSIASLSELPAGRPCHLILRHPDDRRDVSAWTNAERRLVLPVKQGFDLEVWRINP